MPQGLRASRTLRILWIHPGAAAGILHLQSLGRRRDHRGGARGSEPGTRGAASGTGRWGSSHHRTWLGSSLQRERASPGHRLLRSGRGAWRGAPWSWCPRCPTSRRNRRDWISLARGERPAGMAGGGLLALRVLGVRREPAGGQHEFTLVNRRQTSFHASSASRGP